MSKKKTHKKTAQKMQIWTYNEWDSLTSGHKITLDGLTCHLNHSIQSFLINVQMIKNEQFFFIYLNIMGCPHCVMVNKLGSDIIVSELGYYVHFRTKTLGKCMNPLIPFPVLG